MNSIWTKGLHGEAKDKRKSEVLSYRKAFEDLKAILEEHYEDGVPDYDNPSWAYAQADRNGANRKLKQIINLITIKE